MPENSPNPMERDGFQPNEATLAAWEARSYYLAFRNSEPGSEQADTAKANYNQEYARMMALTEPELAAWLLPRTGYNQAATEDIIQDTYLKIYRHLGSFRGDSQIGTFLCKAAYRLLADYYKQEAKQSGRQLRGEAANSDPLSGDMEAIEAMPNLRREENPELSFDHLELQEELVAMLGDVALRHRVAVVLYHGYKWSQAEIASFLSKGGEVVTEMNVKQMISRTRKRIRKRHPNPELVTADD